MQKILIITTDGQDMRARAINWNADDADLRVGIVLRDQYSTPVNALNDGWKLLAPPRLYKYKYREVGSGRKCKNARAEWWFVKDE